MYNLQQNFIANISICIFTAAKVINLSRKYPKFNIDLDFVLIAVTTSQKDYRICYLINKHLGFNFTKISDLSVNIYNDEREVLFSRYHYNWETTETDFYFIANKGSDGYLIPELIKHDYFLLIKNYIDDHDLETLVSALNKIPEILTAVKIAPKKVKSRENLLF